jgi:hypothetical protein
MMIVSWPVPKKDKKLTAVLSQLLDLLSGEEKKLKEKRRFHSSTQK